MINIGVIGIGFMGNKYLEILDIISKTEKYKNKIYLKKIADPSFKKLVPLKDKYKISEITSNPEEILKDPEINTVFIASPPFFHYEQIGEAIKNGKAVYCEKPLTTESTLSFKLSR